MIKSQRPCPISQSYLLSAHAESMNDKELDTTQVKMLQEPSRVARLAKGSGRSAVEVLNLIEVCSSCGMFASWLLLGVGRKVVLLVLHQRCALESASIVSNLENGKMAVRMASSHPSLQHHNMQSRL
eukprot:scaffold249550_cov19-Tisochrysis_lutea.AAC.1